jgi:hypothetical protein
MQNVYQEPHFSGIIIAVFDDSILVNVNMGDELRENGNLVDVTLNLELKDSVTQFIVGNEIIVYHDGTISESNPIRLNKVYAIMLQSPDIIFMHPNDKDSIWVDVSSIDVLHIFDGQVTEWIIMEEKQIDDLHEWFTNLYLIEMKQFSVDESPSLYGGELFRITLHESNTSFAYGMYGTDEYYITYYGEWYRVENPSSPF